MFNTFTLTVATVLEFPLNTLFGWLTRIFYNFFGNYGLAIIALTVVIRALMIPLNISSQRSMLKTQTLQSKQLEIQKKYPDDKQKQQEEMTKMMQENGAMGFSGCLLSILQLVFIWPIYRIVEAPLKYLSQVSEDNIVNMFNLANDNGLTSLVKNFTSEKLAKSNNIPLIELLNKNSDFFRDCISKGYIKAGQLMDLHFLGMDLTKVPSISPKDYMSNPKTYFPLLVIPILVVLTSVISMQLSNVFRPDYKEKKAAKKNPARGQVNDPNSSAEMTTKLMTWMMPILMLVTTFTLPAAMGVYWVVGGIMGILTQVLVYFLLTKPFTEKKEELDRMRSDICKKKKNKNGKKAKA